MRALFLALIACGSQPGDALTSTTSALAAPSANSNAGGLADPIATIGSDPVTLSELEKRAAPGLIAAQTQMYEARRVALDELVMEKLLEKEAAARSVTKEALVVSEVDDKITAVTEADITGFFEQNQRQMRGADLESVRPKILDFLGEQKKGERMALFIEELKQKHAVTDKLEQPRIHVEAGDSPRKGTTAAAIQIVEFSDFQCPYCTRGKTTVDEVLAKYGEQVSVVFRHFPLPFHDRAIPAAEASECAREKGKFWEYHDALFANQQGLTDDDFAKYAKNVGLDAKEFKDCLASGRNAARVQKDLEDGKTVGMNGTPGFYINGIVITGAQPIEEFSKIIDKELGRIAATKGTH